MTEEQTSRILDAGALKALAHPLRVQIYDLLSEQGPQTASSLAKLIGETSGATSYHLRALAAQDLIEELPERGTGRERWWGRPKGQITLPSPDDTTSPSGRAAAQIVNAEYFRLRNQALMEYIGRPRSEMDPEWREVGAVMDSFLTLTPAQAAELQQELADFLTAAHARYPDQDDLPGTRRIAVRLELFDLPTAADRTPKKES